MMKKNSVYKTVFSILFFFLSSAVLVSDEKLTFVLNPGDEKSKNYFQNWHTNKTWKNIYYWSRTYKLELLQDNGPVVDDKAFFVSEFGSYVVINDDRLKKMRFAKLSIDFVSYRNHSGKKVPSFLKMKMMNAETGFFYTRTIRFDDLTGKIYTIEIPYDLLSHGKFKMYFREFSSLRGIWGIWDMKIFQ